MKNNIVFGLGGEIIKDDNKMILKYMKNFIHNDGEKLRKELRQYRYYNENSYFKPLLKKSINIPLYVLVFIVVVVFILILL